jgi:diguanylate cyclase (GGDEF)-like protein
MNLRGRARTAAPARGNGPGRPGDGGVQHAVPVTVMARAGGALYGSGALLVIATLVLPHGDVRYPQGVLGVTLVALVAAAILYFQGERLPGWVFPLISPFGSLMVAAAMFWGGAYAYAYSMLFVWAALYSFSFFSAAAATAQYLCIALCAGFYLFVVFHTADSIGYWLMIAGTGAVAGVLIQRLIRQVETLANVDALTGAFNRRTWDVEMPKAMSRAARSGQPVSVAIADLDHFKVFNDEHGHQAGDRLLADVVTIWRAVLRASDTLARYGGEEFSLILDGCAIDEAMGVVEKLRATMPLGRTCSIGVAQWDGEESPRALLARADAALYEAKRLGRNRSVAAPTRQAATGDSLGDTARWAEVLYGILRHRGADQPAGISAAYQPIVRLHDGKVVGMESLARPSGTAAGLSVEGLFYAAQRLGLTRDLDWACRRIALRSSAGLRPGIPIFVNASVAALLDPVHDVDQMLMLLRWSGHRPEDVVLELTERETVVDLGRLVEVLAQYRAEGFRFAVDDLGEGRSGMEVLAAAVPEYVKIARRLVREDEVGSRSLLSAAVAFARSSGAKVIAEGIETEEDVERVLAAGIELGQGWLLGRPSFEIPMRERLSVSA